MTILSVALVSGGLGLAGTLAYLRWRRDRWDGKYVEQVQAWGAADPQIPQLTLPTVKPLKGRAVKVKRKAAAVLRMTRKA